VIFDTRHTVAAHSSAERHKFSVASAKRHVPSLHPLALQ
jgi:hypothetical protein